MIVSKKYDENGMNYDRLFKSRGLDVPTDRQRKAQTK